MKIEILTSDRALTPCVWDEVPEFVVLTGANGVGKSQFLSAIQRHYGEVGYKGLSVSWSDGPVDADDVLFSGADWGVSNPGPKSIVWLADQRESLNQAIDDIGADSPHARLLRRLRAIWHEARFQGFLTTEQPKTPREIENLRARVKRSAPDSG